MHSKNSAKPETACLPQSTTPYVIHRQERAASQNTPAGWCGIVCPAAAALYKSLSTATGVAISVVAASALFATDASAVDWRGNVSTELTYFPKYSDQVENWKSRASIAADVEIFHDFNDNVTLTVHPFARIDERDDQRTHTDFRELILTTTGDSWEFSGGLGTVFWGVTESRHLVDVINQTDNVEGVDGEDKLGQLMLNLNLYRDSGEFQFYLLPHFRERTFAGIDGRPFIGAVVDESLAQFESDRGDRHIDGAVRWSQSYDYWDIGLHYFNGTARDPLLAPVITDGAVLIRDGTAVLAPRYIQTEQVGLDAQGLFGDLSVKAEIVGRYGDELDDHVELVSGIEYTLVGVYERMDLGIVAEYLWDERGDDATHPFQNDLLAGFRFALNDERSTDALFGIIQDLDGGATTLSLEASTRVFDAHRLSIEARHFTNTSDDSSFAAFRDESFIQLDFSYFF